MSDTHKSDDTIREELVAYLDGELPPEEARAVEERLSRDERYRREMQGFDRAWNALEELPRATVDDSFTKTTIEMVAVAAEKDLAEQTQALPTVRRRRTLWIAGLAAVAATLGFTLARIVLDRPDRVLLANLPLVQHLDAYNQNLSPEFLIALQTQANDILEPYRDEELERQLGALQATEVASTAERRAMVEAMSDGEKAALQANYMRFEQLPHERRIQLVDLYNELRGGKNSEDLQRNMLAYWAWLQERRNGGADQADLRKAEPIEDRLAMMHRIDRGQNRRLSISPEEAAKLRAVVKSLGEDRRFREMSQRLMAEWQRRSGEDSDNDGRRQFRNTVGGIMMLHWTSQRPENEELKPVWEEVHKKLYAALQLETQQRLEREDQPSLQLLRLTGEAMMEGARPSEEELEQFFASGAIDAKRMQELLGMSREEMLRQLRREYFRQEYGEDGPWRWRGDRRGPRGDRFENRDGRRRGEGRSGDDRDRGPDGRERRPNGPPRGERPFDGPPPRPPGNQPPLPPEE